MATMLKKISADRNGAQKSADPVVTTPIAVVAHASLLSGPLKTSREGGTSNKNVPIPAVQKKGDGGARMLNSALQSSRFGKSTPPKQDARLDYDDGMKGNKRTEISGGEEQDSKRFRGPPPRPPNAPPVPAPAVDHKDPVAYFEEMNRIAVQSGFKNAQEMMASQKELMAMMAPVPMAGVPMMGGYYPPAAPFYPPPPQGYYPPPYLPNHVTMHPHGDGGRFGNRGGRGQYGGRFGGRRSHIEGQGPEAGHESLPQSRNAPSPPSEPPMPAVGATNAVEGEDGSSFAHHPTHPGRFAGGRGRGGRWSEEGRGGRWNAQGTEPAAAAPKPVTGANPFAANPFAVKAGQPAEAVPFAAAAAAASSGPVDGMMHARLGYSGRGSRGRGRTTPTGGNKTWVRPDLENASDGTVQR